MEACKLDSGKRLMNGRARAGVPLAWQSWRFNAVTKLTPETSAPSDGSHSGWIAAARVAALLLLVSALANPGWAQTTKPDLGEISLDTLANAEITSVSRKEEKLSQATAAVYVITQEDIRRSGLSNIPELLRMVPGLTVAQINASTWAVTARGFKEGLADKLLVLM